MDPRAAVGCLNVLINSRLLSLTRAHIKIFYQVNFFFRKTLRMDFTQFEAIDESQQNETLNFSDDEKIDWDEKIIDDSEQPMEDVSFYRKFDPENLDHYNTFTNQTRDPRVVVYEDDEMFFGTEDTQSELYDPEVRKNGKCRIW